MRCYRVEYDYIEQTKKPLKKVPWSNSPRFSRQGQDTYLSG